MPSTKITLVSSDEKEFIVDIKVAEMSVTIKSMLEDLPDRSEDTPIPLPNITGNVLKKVIEYCEYHHVNPMTVSEDKKRTDDIIPWDKEFCEVELELLFQMILAANYLDINPMLDLTCKTVANMIKGKTPEEIRKTFSIKNDPTPEEEQKVLENNEWINKND